MTVSNAMQQPKLGELLSVADLEVRYDKAILALHDVSLSIAEGTVVALLGPNGAGKSTLLKAIAGLLPFEQGEISRGQISFRGEAINRRHPALIARGGIALVQEGRQCFRNLSIEENLRAASLAARADAPKRLDMVYSYFPILSEMRGRDAGLLSGGQLQMLVIGMALMTKPALLMLDEPSLGLSPILVQTVFDAVERLYRELGMTLIVAEQTVPRLMHLATDAYVLRSGQVVMHAPPQELDEERLSQAYLGQ